MRLRACLGMMALALGGCAHLPAYVLLDVDGSTIEFKKKVPVPAPEENAAAADESAR